MFVSARVAIFSGAGRVNSTDAGCARRAGRATAEDYGLFSESCGGVEDKGRSWPPPPVDPAGAKQHA